MAERTTRELLERVEAADRRMADAYARAEFEVEVERRLTAERAVAERVAAAVAHVREAISDYLATHGREAFEAAEGEGGRCSGRGIRPCR